MYCRLVGLQIFFFLRLVVVTVDGINLVFDLAELLMDGVHLALSLSVAFDSC